MDKANVAKVRESNIELLRNISMFMILVIHANFVALSKVDYCELVSNTLPALTRFFIESLGIVAVNVFVFISGWFGIRTRTKSVLSFAYQILFFLIGGSVMFVLFGKASFSVEGLMDAFQLSRKDWFIKSYFVLMIIAPILNTYTKNANEKTQRCVMISFFLFEAIYGWALGGKRFFVSGYGPLHFIGLYVTAQYIHCQLQSDKAPSYLKRLFRMPKCMDLCAFVLLALINTIFVVSCSLIFKNVNTFFDLAYAYSNPLVIIAALYLFLFFSKIKMPYIKVINRLGASSFAVYLFHGETTIRNSYFCPIIQNIYNNYSSVACLGMTFLFLCIIYLISVLVDQLRLLSWNRIYN